MLVRIAIVEDEEAPRSILKEMIEQYGKTDSRLNFEVSSYASALVFLEDFHADFDVIFLDILMDDINGIEAARRIRQKDGDVMIVFVTNMAQYALESYEVHAFDFILKPLNYANFSMKFRRVCNCLEHRRSDVYITLSTRFEVKRLAVSDIAYVEVRNHDLFFRLKDGEYRIPGTMSAIEKRLKDCYFVRCSSSFLVNLRYVTRLKGDIVEVGGDEIRISRIYRSEFLGAFSRYAGGGV